MEQTVPFHKSLMRPDHVLGVPAALFYALLFGAFYVGLAFGFRYSLAVAPVYAAARLVCKNDPDFLAILADCICEPDILEG